jgi:hypothetical protein
MPTAWMVIHREKPRSTRCPNFVLCDLNAVKLSQCVITRDTIMVSHAVRCIPCNPNPEMSHKTRNELQFLPYITLLWDTLLWTPSYGNPEMSYTFSKSIAKQV